jgi:hypothetical protein
MYYVMLIAEAGASVLARPIALAQTSLRARLLAQELDGKLHGQPSGRTFYLDEGTYIRWRVDGMAAAVEPGVLPD